jgi:predicted ATPase
MSGGQVNRVEQDPSDVAAFGPFQLFATERRLERNGEPVEVGGRALDVLIELVNQAGRVVSRAELMSTLWADTSVVEGVLRTHVYNLRKILGDGVGGMRYITSVAGRGYCFVAPVIHGAGAAVTRTASNAPERAHGLPPRLARIAGRDDALRLLAAQLAEHRFVTVVGAAGIGKTTIAVAVGHALLDDFAGAVRFIDLGALTEPGLVAATVAATLGASTQTDDVLGSLEAFLQGRRVLIVLDHCEHVVDAAAHLAAHLFAHAPEVHLLTTSREPLRVEGEYAHRLDPLATPTTVRGMTADRVQQFPAVQIFVERAVASGWAGELGDDDVPIVVEICQHLDGVPLALELAASFVGEYGLGDMAAALDDRLRPRCPQTLHALIAWRYERLREAERAVLRRLSVFIGTFAVDAARAIALEDGEPAEALLEIMSELVGKSMLSADVEDGAVAYRLHETTRVHALEQLADSGERDRIRLCHARRFAERPARAADLGDVRAALAWSFASPATHPVGVRLAAAAAKMLLERGLVRECRGWCRRALQVIAAPELGTLVELGLQEAFALSAMFSRGNGDDVRRSLVRGVELAHVIGDGDHEVRLLGHLNTFLIRRGELQAALEIAERTTAPARRATIASQVQAKCLLALSHHLCGNQATAEDHCESILRLEATAAALPRGAPGLFSHAHLATLARTQWLRGQVGRALATARRVVEGVDALPRPLERSSALILCEAVFIWCGAWADAARLLDMLDELIERNSLGCQRGAAMALRGELLVRTGRAAEGCGLLRIAAAMRRVEHDAMFATVYTVALAEGLDETGAHEEALAVADQAIRDAEQRGGTFDLPELLRVKGLLLASQPAVDEHAVDDTLSAAVELARRQGALTWELRATTTWMRERIGRERLA